jgi:TonB family protein
VEPDALPFAPAASRPRPRDFVPPARKTVAAEPVALAAAPEVEGVRAGPQAVAGLPKTFMPPPARPMDLSTPTLTAEAPMVIVGLNPANVPPPPVLPPSRPASFSAGPELRKDGASEASNGPTMINVPGLTVKSGVKDDHALRTGVFSATSQETLMAAARMARNEMPVVKAPSPEGRSTRVSEAPDPMLAGRVVYTVAIQMPNVTSFSGSWLVWFAEREPVPGATAVDMRAPVPLRKVDPKYVAAAVAERVEGIVRLRAVIRKDGHVEGISLLRHLDDRLDRTSEEALAKWEFTPALRNGKPVDVDAVFEIPFHLAPRATK